MTMKRRVIMLVGLIAIIIAMLLCCGSAMAASSGTYDGISWYLSDDGVLTLGNGGTQTMTLNNNRDSYSWPWTNLKTSIKSVKCNGSVIAKGSLVGMFSGCSNLVSVDMGNVNTSAVTKMSALFSECSSLVSLDLSQWDVSQVTDMNSMFSSCTALETVDVSGWNTSSARDMEHMFYRCNKLTTLDVSSWDVSRVYDMGYMFYDCFVLNSLDVSGWYTNALQYMSDMFYRCRKLQRLDMKNFNTSNVRNMDRVFLECYGLTYLDVSHFNTSNVTSMQMMFFECSQLENIDVSNWNVSNVTRFSGSYGMAEAGFFEGCGSLKYLDLSNWNTRRCTDANNFNCFFDRCFNLTRITLGERFVFPARSCLPTPSYCLNGVFYTGKWVHEDGVAGPCTPIELMESYDASMAGTWIWEEGEVVYTVKFESSEPDVTAGSMPNRYFVPTVANPLYWPSFSAYKRTFDHWEDDRGNYYARGSSIPAGRFEIGDVVTMTAYWTHPDWLVTMENGEFDISLVGGETAVFENIPANTSYAVYEETPRGWVLVGVVNTSGVIQTLDRSEARFVNQYDPEKASIHLAVQKLLDGKPAEVDSFYFGLQSEDGTLMQIKGVSDGGLVLFDPIEFTEDDAGIHVFSIYELGSDDNIIYDTHVQDITVDVQYIENVTVYSHSDNLDDNGIKQSDYVSNQYYTDIVTIPGAESLHVKIVYTNPRGQFYVWKGVHEGVYTQTYSSDFSTSTAYKSYYYQSGRDQEYLTDEFDIDGDSLTVLYSSYAFQPGTSSYSDMVNYGYYMTVSNNNNGFSVDVNYDQDGMVFENVSKPGKLVLAKTSATSHSSDDMFIYEVQFTTENGQPYELFSGDITYEEREGGVSEYPDLQPLPEKQKYTLTVAYQRLNMDGTVNSEETSEYEYYAGDMFELNDLNDNKYKYQSTAGLDVIRVGDIFRGIMSKGDNRVDIRYAPLKTATIDRTKWQNSVTNMSYSSSLPLRTASSFRQNTSYASVDDLPSGAVRIDDATTDFSVYFWKDGNNAYWWSDAEIVYLPADASGMFYQCSSLTSLDLSGFDTSNVTNMLSMFMTCNGLTSLDVSGWNTSNVTDMSDMFSDCTGLTSLDLSGWNTSNVMSMEFMFSDCSGLTSLDLSGFDTSNVTKMTCMFSGCRGLTSMDVSGWNTLNVTDMGSMFYECSGLISLDLSEWDVSSVKRMESMFHSCYGLTSLDLSGLDTSNVKNMHAMFYNCSGLTSLDVSGWDTSKVTTMNAMFSKCSSLTSLDLSEWDTSRVTDMSSMFRSCSGLTSLNLSGFDTSNATIGYMYFDCLSLREVTLGENNVFKGKGTTSTVLPLPPFSEDGITYTRKWIREDGAFGPYTSEELRDNYTSDMAGKWIWEVQ